MKEQELIELIEHLIELDKEIHKSLDDLKKLMKCEGYLITDQQQKHYIT